MIDKGFLIVSLVFIQMNEGLVPDSPEIVHRFFCHFEHSLLILMNKIYLLFEDTHSSSLHLH